MKKRQEACPKNQFQSLCGRLLAAVEAAWCGTKVHPDRMFSDCVMSRTGKPELQASTRPTEQAGTQTREASSSIPAAAIPNPSWHSECYGNL